LHLDLADMTTIKKSADEFMKKEQRLDVLTNSTTCVAIVSAQAQANTPAQTPA